MGNYRSFLTDSKEIKHIIGSIMKDNKDYQRILEIKTAFENGENITSLLRHQKGVMHNTSDIIELAYDLQAGSYIEYVKQNREYLENYTNEMTTIINHHITTSGRILDVGCGELTTLSLLIPKLNIRPRSTFALDVSWSRLSHGIKFAKNNIGDDFCNLNVFTGEINAIPLKSKSISTTISNHALEPNGGRERILLNEIFRVTSDLVLLFEPCYELNTAEGKARMDKLGYIKGLKGAINDLGGKLLDQIAIKQVSNTLNPTVCFVIKPPQKSNHDKIENTKSECIYTLPGSDYGLKKIDNTYFSTDTGLIFPIIKNIPILRTNAGIVATAFNRNSLELLE